MLKKLFGWGKQDAPAVDPEGMRLGVDIEMGYCPYCGDEYRAGIGRCAVCGVKLISGSQRLKELQILEKEQAARSMDIGPDDDLVAIRNGKLKDLKPLQRLLALEVIPSQLVGEAGGCSRG